MTVQRHSGTAKDSRVSLIFLNDSNPTAMECSAQMVYKQHNYFSTLQFFFSELFFARFP